MRRWIGVGVLVVLLGGCSLPAGADGKLTDDWPALPKAELWSPQAGECSRQSLGLLRTLSAHSPTDCAEKHLVETVHVGAFTGEHASRATPPPEGSPEHRAAFAECTTKTTEFLGADFRTGRVWLGIGMPVAAPWTAGARWFTCDLWEHSKEDEFITESPRTGSLRDALKSAGPLVLGCYAVIRKDNRIDRDPVGCDKPHNAEFAGIAVANDVPYPKGDAQQWDVFGKRCWPVVGAYAGLRNDNTLERRVDLIYQGLGQAEWNRGNRGVRCWLRLDKNVTRSMRGAGPAAFPVR